MKPLPGQLSLPLFEPEQATDCSRNSSVNGKPRSSRRAVAASRTLSPQVRPSNGPEAAAAPATGLLTTSEAASLLHVHPRTVQRLVERGQLGAIRLGAAVRFDPADLTALTARLKVRAEAAPNSNAALWDDPRARRTRSARTVPSSPSFRNRLRLDD
jgi:excisionase family DNA binding protein